MPVSGNQETGVKSYFRQSRDYLAGVPIKKRRFPLINPPSPPAEEPSEGKDQSIPCQGSTISPSSVAASSSDLSMGIKNPEAEEKRGGSVVSSSVAGSSSDLSVAIKNPEAEEKRGGSIVSSSVAGSSSDLSVAIINPEAEEKRGGSIVSSSVAGSSSDLSVAIKNPEAEEKRGGSIVSSSVAGSSSDLSVAIKNPEAEEKRGGSIFSSSVAGSSSDLSVAITNPEAEEKRGGSVVLTSVAGSSSDLSNVSKNPEAEEKSGSSVAPSRVSLGSSGLSNAISNHEAEEKKKSSIVSNDNVVEGSVNFAKVKEEPSLTGNTCSFGLDGKHKLVAKSPAPQVTSGNNELKFALPDSRALNVGNIMHIKQRVNVKSETDVFAAPETTELSLGLKESLVPSLAAQTNDRSSPNLNALRPISLNLSLSKEISSSQCKKDDDLNVEDAHVRASRANWDLNTPMDTWEGSSSTSAVVQTSLDGMDTTGRIHYVKSFVRPSGIVGIGVPSEESTTLERPSLANFAVSSSLSDQHYKSDDSLCLSLCPSSLHLNVNRDPSTSSPRFDSDKVVSIASLPRLVEPSSNLNKVNVRAVKPEPVDESVKLDPKGAKAGLGGLFDPLAVKKESIDRGNSEAVKSLIIHAQKLVDPRSIKSEPTSEFNKHKTNLIEGASLRSNKELSQGITNLPSATAVRTSSETPCPVGKPSTSALLSVGRDLSSNSGQLDSTDKVDSMMHQEACEGSTKVAPHIVASSTGVKHKVDATRDENANDNPEQSKSKSLDNLPLHSRGNGEGTASDEEKVNISVDEQECAYGSDCESDGNLVDMEIDAEDDYEDGEVREPLQQTAVEVSSVCEKGEAENVNSRAIDNNLDSVGPLNNVDLNPSVEDKDGKIRTAETKNKDAEERHDVVHNDKCDNESDKTVCLQESSIFERPADGVQGSLDQSGSESARMFQEAEVSYQLPVNGSEATFAAFTQGTDLSANKTDIVLKDELALVNSSSNGDNTVKDTDGGNRSRIINLPRSSNSISPSRTRPISVRPFPSRTGRERFSDVAFERDRMHSRGREEFYVDDTQKFYRERHQDQSPRNSRMNFMRGRGRFTNNRDNYRGDRESDRDFGSEFFNGPTEFRVPRHKYSSTVSNADLEYNAYNNSQDGGFIGSGRGGRKPLNDEGPIVRQMPSRRRSPGAGRGINMVRRIPRNISPSRCVGEDGSEFVGIRRGEKFMRGFPDDAAGPMFSRTQPSYEGVDGQFPRGNRNFSTVQRRFVPRIRSKSPLNSRARSPGQWSSPRRRSPEGFTGHPDMTHQRSPPFYRMERMIRSPDRPCFPGEVVVRRHDLREDSGRDNGHPRSVISNRSPGGTVIRNRRFEVIDPQERPEGDNFFGGPVHSSRVHELGGDANVDEGRRFGVRRGPVRPFRTPFNGSDGENFHVNPEDGTRHFRFCPDDNAQFQERGNLREREFDRRIKNQPGNATRRMRNIEEQQETDFRQNGQAWQEDGFDEMSRLKRKRF